MKKHDEGYALVFVVVVMLVLSLVALSMMTAALKNLQTQTASVEQMKAKYKAEGEIEKIIVTIAHKFDTRPTENNVYVTGNADPKADLDSKLAGELNAILTWYEGAQNTEEYEFEWEAKSDWWTEISEKSCSRKFAITVRSKAVEIKCEITLTDVIKFDSTNNYWYIDVPEIAYTSYTITYPEQTDPSEGGGAE